MGSGMSFGMLLVILLSGGGGNDSLDCLPTDDYWKAKAVAVTAETLLAELKPAAALDANGAADWVKKLGAEKNAVREEATCKLRAMGAAVLPLLREAAKSSDPEVVTRVEMLLKDIRPADKAGSVRRLMAIRTLGERKDKDALPALKGLLDSNEPFVADYSRRAVAAIEGKPFTRPRASAETLQKDLWLLPRNCGLVAQLSLTFGQGLSFDKMLADMADEKDVASEKLTSMILSVVERVGNTRLDVVTIGVSDVVGNRAGFAVVIARGQYVPEALKAAFRPSMDREPEVVDGMEVYSPARDAGFIFASGEQLVLVIGMAREKLPLSEVIGAIKKGKGGLADNAAMARLIKGLDTSKPIWAAATISEAYAKVPFLASFQTITLTADLKDDSLECKLSAQGADANQVKECVAAFEQIIEGGKKELERGGGPHATPWQDGGLPGHREVPDRRDRRHGDGHTQGRLQTDDAAHRMVRCPPIDGGSPGPGQGRPRPCAGSDAGAAASAEPVGRPPRLLSLRPFSPAALRQQKRRQK